MNINVILPIAGSDRGHIAAQVNLLMAHGPYDQARFLIIPTPTAMGDPIIRPEIDRLTQFLTQGNFSMRLDVAPNDFQAQWPYAPGAHFRHAVDTLELIGWDDCPFIWMEPDLNPIKGAWVPHIINDYIIGSTPFRGMIEKTRYEDTNPATRVVTPRYDGSVHLVGAGMYPHHYIQFRCPVNGSPMASYRNPSPTIPFDIKCQDQHRPATQSPLWLHKPRTVNWRRIAGNRFTCEDQKADPFGLTYAGEVDLSSIYLVHGCKDGSLAQAILHPSEAAVVHSTAIPDWAPIAPVPFEMEPPQSALLPSPVEGQIPPQSHELGSTPDTVIAQLEERVRDLEEDLQTQIDHNTTLFRQNAELTERLKAYTEAGATSQSTETPALPPIPSTTPKSVKPPAKKAVKKRTAA